MGQSWLGYLFVWRALKGDGPFAWLQKVLTGVAYRHTSGGVGDIYGDGRQWQFEMYVCGTTTPLPEITSAVCRRWRVNAPENAVRAAFINCAVQNSGRVYGFRSLLNYLPRRIVELFGANGQKVAPIHTGDVCSSAWLADCIVPLATAMEWKDVLQAAQGWNRNVFHSGDMVRFLLMFPDKFVEEP